MTKSTTRVLLLVLACLCRVSSYGQANSQIRTADQANFSSFSQKATSSKEAWKKFNSKASYNHPEFGTLAAEAPCKECVELLDRRKADERVFRNYADTSEILIQKSMGDMHYRKNGQWITIEDKLKQVGPGKYQSDYYIEPVGIDATTRSSYILTPQGKVYFNQWSLYAKTAAGETLLAKADWSHYTAGDDGVYVTNIFKGIDAELRVYRGAVKTSFIMKKNEYGVFDQLLFRDEYRSNGPTRIGFADKADQKTGVGKLAVYSGNTEVLQVNEAVIYPKGAAKNNILTAAYTINDKYMDVLVPYTWINDNIGQHELVIDPTVTGSATLTAASIIGSRYNASCSFDSSCNYSLAVNIPAATTVTGILYSFTYLASAPCFGADGGVKFGAGSCSSQLFTNQSQTPGPTIMNLVPITSDLQACIPAPSCSVQSLTFNMQFFRSCKGLSGCSNTCIGAAAPWIMTIKGKTVEFNEPSEPISYTTNNICVGDSIYVSTWANFGVPPYNYSWSFNPSGTPSLGTGASTSIVFPNIVNNTIYAIITDACNNTAIDSLPITVNFAAVTATPTLDTLCSGEMTGISLTSPVAGTSYSWTVVQNGVMGASAGNGNSIEQVLTTVGGTQGMATYTITPQNGGCTGVPVTVTVIVNPPIIVMDNITICTNQIPFTWHNQAIFGGGNYIATYSTPSLVTGCDSTTVLNLTVNPVITHTVNQTICAGQLPYTWNGISITAGGNGVATFTSTASNNCDSVTTLNLNVVNTLTATVSATICASQLPYLWNGISVTAGGMAAAVYNTPSIISGCDSITTLNLMVHPLPATTVNVALCANQMPYTWNGQTITAGGTAVATYTTASLATGCDSTATLNLTVHPLINTQQNITICANQMPYAWNGQTITTGGTAVATHTTPSLLTGCDSTTTLNLTVNPLLYQIKNVTICAGQLPYTWNGFTLTSGGNAAAVFITPSLVTGCDSTTTLNLTVNPVLTATVNTTICTSQLPYTWNGQSITAGGTAVATYTTPSLATGCDSTTTLNLTVNPVLTATVNTTICASQLPYTWNGISVTAGGTAAAVYTTGSAQSGCDSMTTLHLTVNPLPTAAVNVVLCANQMPYTWNGQTITAGGTAVASFVSPSLVSGCDSTTTLNLTVHPLITAVKNITICANQLPYTWNGQTVTAGGTAVATYTSPSLVTGCDSTTTLNLTVNPLLTAIKNVTICASQFPYTWNGIAVTTGGTAAAVFTTPSLVTGCDSTTTLNLTVNPLLTAIKNVTICASQLPYTWNGITVTTGGATAAVFTTPSLATGCDSTTTLNLTVNPVLTATKNITICAGQLPYAWNGITVTAGGAAAAVFTTPSLVTACDSTTTLNLTVNPVLTATKNITICASQLPYTWNGITVAAGGPAAASYTTTSLVTGCDSATTLNLTMNPLIQATKNISICNSQLPYTWNGIVVTVGGTAVATYTTPSLLTGCDSTTTLNLTVNPVLTAVKSITICASQLPYTWNNISVAAGGTAVATYTMSSLVTNCDSTTTLNLTVNPVLTATKNVTICSGQLPYTWNGVTLSAGGTAAAVYTTPSLVTGCDSTTTLNLTVVPALSATQNISICASQLPYTWNGITITTGGAAAATYTTTASNNCDSVTTLNLTIKPVYAATIDTNICAAQTPFAWNGQGYSSSGNYTHTFSSVLGCDSVITLALHVSPAPVTPLPKDSIGCGIVYFKGNTYTVSTTVHDTLYNALGCDSVYRTTYVKVLKAYADTLKAEICANEAYTWGAQTYNQSGWYSHKYTTPLGCDSILNLQLKVWPVSQVSITHDLQDVPCVDDTITVTGNGATDYRWKLNGLDVGHEATGRFVLAAKENIIKVLAKDDHGCASEAAVTIETKACCEMMIPNAFSPNGDGLNDKYGPETMGNPKEFKMMIFNRYGQLMFTSVSISDRWDGTFNGKPVDMGTYFYRIYTKCTTDVEKTFKGDVTLIR